MIVDAHVHIAPRLTGFWQPLRYGRVSDEGRTLRVLPPSFDPPASPAELALAHMDHAGVDRAMSPPEKDLILGGAAEAFLRG